MVRNQRCWRTLPEKQRKTRRSREAVVEESRKGLLDWAEVQEETGRVPRARREHILRMLEDILRKKTGEEASVAG